MCRSSFLCSFLQVLTIPIDTCKVRLQLQGRSTGPVKYRWASLCHVQSTRMHNGVNGHVVLHIWLSCCRGTLHTLTTVAREEGVRSLWKGLVPGLHRQVLLGGVRIASCEL